MCLAGTVVVSWFLTQEVAGSSPFNDKYFVNGIQNSVKLFRKNYSWVNAMVLFGFLATQNV